MNKPTCCFRASLLSLCLLAGCAPTTRGVEVRPVASAATTGALDAARTLESRGAYLEAARLYAEAYEHEPSAATAIGRGRSLRHAGQAEQAVLWLDGAARDFPRESDIRLELGRAALAGGFLPEAAAALAEARAGAPDDWRVAEAEGLLAARQGDNGAALAAFDRALALVAEPPPALLANRALAQAADGQLDPAIAGLEALARKPGADSRIRLNLALLYGLRGQMADFDRLARPLLPEPGFAATRAWLQDRASGLTEAPPAD